ncbi:hypothetical protein BDV93DRAFT_518610 [Ceratobasidium sp. AG-I]|nr:hypothetical protein BDV93DRAFT_518610 [Ceratobasidium sp. AG-I]
MPTFDSLPEDILRLVLVLSTPDTIRYCQQICRLLRKIIQEDPCIQYLLDLDACGYVEPRTPRSDLSYSEKREVIRLHQLRWSHPQGISPEVYDIHTSGGLWMYVSGVYARGGRLPGSMPVTARQLYFYQLPSPNRGTEYKHWIISELGVDTCFFMIDPEQDLLVLIEADNAHPGDCIYNLHLRTMSDGRIHPKALLGSSTLVYRSLSMWTQAAIHTEIYGHLLAVRFPSKRIRGLTHIVIWDWTLGIELTRVPTTSQRSSFTLISEDLLVFPNFLDPYSRQHDVSEGEFDALDVYQFDPQANAFTEPTRIASFALPSLNNPKLYPNVFLRCAPTARVSTTGASSASCPKVFDLAPDNRLLCLEIIVTGASGYNLRTSEKSFYIHPSALLDIIAGFQKHQASRTVVPWVDWAEKTSWVDTGYLAKRAWFGQRVAGFDSKTYPFDPKLDILDFDERRIKTQLMSEAQSGWEVRTPGDQILAGDLFEQIEEDIFCNRSDVARRKYMKDTFPVVGGLRVKDRLMIDDEHVVIERRALTGNGALLVYTF